ncbi:MAG: hypothetical protein A2031_03440 [Deltaproteobacteria bacterium RBG_19FT_COMBO_43_11]|nr:MAG: hypothetical protein A2031_03440 [Deltaproteobacteria bacterium RBG_19FT_COMBO_43_11]
MVPGFFIKIYKILERNMFDFNNETYNLILKQIYRYLKNLFRSVNEAVFLISFTMAFYIIILYYTKYWWYLFKSTNVGQVYAEQFYYNYQMTNDVLDRNVFDLSIDLTITSFVICFLVSSFCQIFFISRYLYSGRGSFTRIIFLGLPLTYIVAAYIMPVHEFNNMDTAFIMAVIPTFCVFMGCFRLSEKLLPEFDDIIRKVNQLGKSLFG